MAINSATPKVGKILDLPANAPTIGTATDLANGGGVTVAYTPGSTAVGGPVYNYTATSTPGSVSATGTSSPITVSGLTVGTSYTFTVKANNPSGSSPLSAASNAVTPSVPPTSYDSIATATGTGSSAVITFSSIPSTYKHLQIRTSVRTSYASSQDDMTITFNSDTAANYTYHYIQGAGGGLSASGAASANGMINGNYAAGSTTTTLMMGTGIVDIVDYASTTKNKVVRVFNGKNNNTTPEVIRINSGMWMSTSAITSITLTFTGNATTTSTFALYGIKG